MDGRTWREIDAAEGGTGEGTHQRVFGGWGTVAGEQNTNGPMKSGSLYRFSQMFRLRPAW